MRHDRLIAKLKEKEAELVEELRGLREDLWSVEGRAVELAHVCLAPFLNTPLQDIPWLVKGLIPSKSVGIVSADGGVGKTTLMAQIGLCLAAGRSVLGVHARQPARILHVLHEGAGKLFQERVRATARALRLETDAGYTWAVSPHSDTIHRIGSAGLEHMVKQFQPDLLILDTLSLSAVYDENDSKEWKKAVMVPIRELTFRHGCAVVLVHHHKKAVTGGNQDGRGTSAMRDDVDFWLRLVIDGEPSETVERQLLWVDKQRYGPSKWPMKLDYHKRDALFERVEEGPKL